MTWWRTKPKFTVHTGATSDAGRVRSENQDAHGCFPGGADADEQLFVVADGMGGHAHGREASRLAVSVVHDRFVESAGLPVGERLREALESANAEILFRSRNVHQAEKMGTTCTALALSSGRLFLAHVGDSRAYRVRDGRVTQLTHDHTLVEDMRRGGILTEEEARHHPRRHTLTRVLGVADDVEVDVVDLGPASAPDCYVLCTDGVAEVPVHEIRELTAGFDPQEASARLVARANDLGGMDNSTVLIVCFT